MKRGSRGSGLRSLVIRCEPGGYESWVCVAHMAGRLDYCIRGVRDLGKVVGKDL